MLMNGSKRNLYNIWVREHFIYIYISYIYDNISYHMMEVKFLSFIKLIMLYFPWYVVLLRPFCHNRALQDLFPISYRRLLFSTGFFTHRQPHRFRMNPMSRPSNERTFLYLAIFSDIRHLVNFAITFFF